jgi:hypothetical protein
MIASDCSLVVLAQLRVGPAALGLPPGGVGRHGGGADPSAARAVPLQRTRHAIGIAIRDRAPRFLGNFFWVRSCLYVKLDAVHICTEIVFIFQEILRASLILVHQCSSIIDLWPCHTLTGVGSRRTISISADAPLTSLQM